MKYTKDTNASNVDLHRLVFTRHEVYMALSRFAGLAIPYTARMEVLDITSRPDCLFFAWDTAKDTGE